MLTKARAALRVLSRWTQHGKPSPHWLFASSSRIDAKFNADHADELGKVTQDDHFQYLTFAGEVYVWPKDQQLDQLRVILSELTQKHHPHHYDVEPTLVMPGDIVLDIGACEGAFSAYAVQRGAEAVLVEPSSFMTAVCERLFELRGLPPPKMVKCLLGETEKVAHFFDDETRPGASCLTDEPNEQSYPIPMMTLDGFAKIHLPKGVNYIKCDAEGWDTQILKSGREMLLKYKPKIAITTYHNAGDYAEMAAFLTPLGYECSGKGLLFSGDALRTLMLHAVPKKA